MRLTWHKFLPILQFRILLAEASPNGTSLLKLLDVHSASTSPVFEGPLLLLAHMHVSLRLPAFGGLTGFKDRGTKKRYWSPRN